MEVDVKVKEQIYKIWIESIGESEFERNKHLLDDLFYLKGRPQDYGYISNFEENIHDTYRFRPTNIYYLLESDEDRKKRCYVMKNCEHLKIFKERYGRNTKSFDYLVEKIIIKYSSSKYIKRELDMGFKKPRVFLLWFIFDFMKIYGETLTDFEALEHGINEGGYLDNDYSLDMYKFGSYVFKKEIRGSEMFIYVEKLTTKSPPKKNESVNVMSDLQVGLTQDLKPFSLYFNNNNNNNNVGNLFIKDGKLDFVGDVTESADIFFKKVKELFNK